MTQRNSNKSHYILMFCDGLATLSVEDVLFFSNVLMEAKGLESKETTEF